MGIAIAQRLTASGMSVAGLDRSPSAACEISFVGDVTSADDVIHAVTETEKALGPIYAVVSGAGHYESIPFTDVTDEQAQRMLRVHLGGFFACAQAVLPGMIARKEGSLIAITSELAVGGGDRDSHYAAAKGAVLGVVRSLATELAPTGVRVNSVAPGPTNTPLLAPDSPWRAPEYLATLPTGDLAQPLDVALCGEYLISGAQFMTGEVLNPNSGAVI